MTFLDAFFTLCLFNEMYNCSGKDGGPGTGGEYQVCLYEMRGMRSQVGCYEIDDFIYLAEKRAEGGR